MSGKGIFFGALIGLLITQRVWGAAIGAVVGFLLYEGGGFGRAAGGARQTHSISISDEFFRTTFELMGHVAKSDGRVSEAEIDAARRLMQELRLGPREISIAIECFRNGKSASYDAELGVERLREACGQRHDLLRAFMELQLRAALAGNGISPPARTILLRVAERLGMSGLEFAYLEASLRARHDEGVQTRLSQPGDIGEWKGAAAVMFGRRAGELTRQDGERDVDVIRREKHQFVAPVAIAAEKDGSTRLAASSFFEIRPECR